MEINEKLSSAIFNVGRLIREKINLNCSRDFTQSEIEILKFIDGNKNITMREIADYLHIKPSSATPVIDSLAKKRFIKRTTNKKDRRIVYINLTAKGLKSLQKKYKTIHKTIKQVFGRLNKKDKETLVKILEKIK